MAGKQVTQSRQVDSFGAGSYSAAPNLILRVKPSGARSWVFRYTTNGKPAEIGLGKAGEKERGLAEARTLAEKMRAAVRDGKDPKSVLKPRHDPTALTFKDVAANYITYLRGTKLKGKERNAKAIDQWETTLAKWVYPKLGAMRPSEISYRDVQGVLTGKGLADLAETQKRVRQRIKVILDEAAKEENEPHRYNPALSFKLEPRSADRIKHHAACPWGDVPAVMDALRAKEATSALLLRFSILTAARSGEARGCRWDEIDGDTWTIPAARMKAGKLHRVPLNSEALAILEIMAGKRAGDQPLVFPGARGSRISDVAINKVLHAAKAGVTAHGFRSSFRQWIAEATNFSREAAELALAHTNPNKVEASYQRSDLFDARITIMAAWGKFLAGADNVVHLAPAASKVGGDFGG